MLEASFVTVLSCVEEKEEEDEEEGGTGGREICV